MAYALRNVVSTLPKDPHETAIFTMNWSARLATKIILTSVWEIVDDTAELILGTDGIVEGGRSTYVTVSNGEDRKTYILQNTVTLNSGEIWQRSGKLEVRQA